MFENESAKVTLNELNVDASKGLNDEEVKIRKEKYGLNKLVGKKKKPLFLIFLSQFNNPMIYILLAAAILSVAISIYSLINFPEGQKPDIIEIISDPIIILSVCVINAIIGTVQESKAEKSLEALKKLSSPTCLVRRNGQILEIKAEELVVGDIVILEEGRTVPADLRLIETINLKTDESSLTGESLPIEKDANIVFSKEISPADRINCAYMSTPVVYGRGEGVVVATGMNTETGKIAKLLNDDNNEQTPLQKKLGQLSKFLGILTIVIVIVIFGIQLIRVFGFTPQETWIKGIIDNFMFSISLAVAAIPEGLPAVVTIVLALGVQRMVKANTIVRKLPSVETLGAVSTVCSDKTGTLTQNKMTVIKAYFDNKLYENDDLNNESLHFLSNGLCLCSNAEIEEGIFGDPTEIALVEFAKYHGFSKKELENKYPRIDEYPFDSVRKMMSTKHRNGEDYRIFTKGALDSILKNTKYIYKDDSIKKITQKDIDDINSISENMSKSALRVLALAYKDSEDLKENDLVFVGLVGMIDPPRNEAKDAVNKFKEAGITTIMITGDHKITALAIAKQLGIADNENQAISGEEIDKLSFEQLQEKVKTLRIFARVSPENKVQIVKAIKANGEIVAMTGDGVNDAPSLKAADIGIAMGITGTDVAKGAAEMILTDDNFASIEKAVEEGRGIYANIKKTVIFLLGTNIAEVLVMFICAILCLFPIFSALPTPLLSVHILWVNLITDSLPAIALGADEKDPGVMNEKPRNPKESLFSKGGLSKMLTYGGIITLSTILAFFLVPVINNGWNFDPNAIMSSFNDPSILLTSQTCAFCTLSFCELIHMLNMSKPDKSFVHNFKNKNWLIWLAFGLGIALQVFVVSVPGINTFFKCQPLNWWQWILVIALSLLPLVAHEIYVLFKYISKKKHKKIRLFSIK